MKDNTNCVSIIVPVYNIVNNLKHCLKSIVMQTYGNLEIILVDDGSTDGSAELCDELSKKDSRIRVIHQMNAGVSAARNTGIENAHGDYIMFVDGDDIISKDSVTILLDDMKNNNSILSGFGFSYIASYRHNFPEHVSNNAKSFNSCELLADLIIGKYIFIQVWGKIFPKTLISSLRFAEGRGANEDKFFLFQYLMQNDGIVTQRPDCLYGYYVRPGSACNSSYSKRILDHIYFSNRILKEVSVERPELLLAAEYNDVGSHLVVLKAIVRSHKYKSEQGDFIKVKNRLLSRYNKPMSFFGRHKYEIIALRISDYIYILMVLVYDLIHKRKK